jgi:hypothetical protein
MMPGHRQAAGLDRGADHPRWLLTEPGLGYCSASIAARSSAAANSGCLCLSSDRTYSMFSMARAVEFIAIAIAISR